MSIITGSDSIDYARQHGLTLSTHATALEPEGLAGLTPDQAERWVRQEPGAGLLDLVYVTISGAEMERYVVAEGEDADEWSRHATIEQAREEARRRGPGAQIWRAEDYDGAGGAGPVEVL